MKKHQRYAIANLHESAPKIHTLCHTPLDVHRTAAR